MIAIFPKLAECAEKGNTEKLVCMVRSYFGEDARYAPALNLDDIFQRIGIKIEDMPIQGMGALIGRDRNGTFSLTAVINRRKIQSERQRKFLLGSLLGHFFLFVQADIIKGEFRTSGVQENHCPMDRFVRGAIGGSEQDRMADEFASGILMPRAMVVRASQNFDQLDLMAEFFDVEERVLRKRMELIGCALSRIVPPKSEPSQKGKGVARVIRKGREDTSDAIEVEGKLLNTEGKKDVAAVTDSKKKSSLEGINRLREIARRMDPSVG